MPRRGNTALRDGRSTGRSSSFELTRLLRSCTLVLYPIRRRPRVFYYIIRTAPGGDHCLSIVEDRTCEGAVRTVRENKHEAGHDGPLSVYTLSDENHYGRPMFEFAGFDTPDKDCLAGS